MGAYFSKKRVEQCETLAQDIVKTVGDVTQTCIDLSFSNVPGVVSDLQTVITDINGVKRDVSMLLAHDDDDDGLHAVFVRSKTTTCEASS